MGQQLAHDHGQRAGQPRAGRARRGRLGAAARRGRSVTKLLLVEAIDLIGRLVADLSGPRVYLDADDTFLWSQFVLGAPACTSPAERTRSSAT